MHGSYCDIDHRLSIARKAKMYIKSSVIIQFYIINTIQYSPQSAGGERATKRLIGINISPSSPPLRYINIPFLLAALRSLYSPGLSDSHDCPETLSPGHGQAHCQSPCKPEREQERRYPGKPSAIPSALHESISGY